jgi:hypothetical protein
VLAYKFLEQGAIGPFSGFPWPAPGATHPGEWVSARQPLEPCGPGIHACRTQDLPFWLNDELWEIELNGEVVEERQGLIAEHGRLLRRYEDWPPAAVELARGCSRNARDTAVRALDDHGLANEAEGLATEKDVEALRAGFEAVARSVGDEHVSRIAFYAADVAGYAARALEGDAAWTSCTAYATALLEGYAAARDASAARTHPAYMAERERQAQWLAARLGLQSDAAS